MIGKVTNLEIKKNKDGKQNVLLLQVQVTEARDVQSIQQSQSNLEMVPEVGDVISIYRVNDSFKIANVFQNGVPPDATLESGECKLYAKQGSLVKSFLTCKIDGEIYLNGKDDWACRFSALEAMIADLNSKFDAHIHPTGSGNTGAPTSPLDLDPSAIKVENVRVS